MIRNATKEDIARVAEIIVFGKRVAYRPIFKNDLFSFNELQVLSWAQNYYDHLVLIKNMLVYDDGIVKGVVNRKYVDKRVEIFEFYVEPCFKGSGIGSLMISKVIEMAKQEELERIFLWVIEDNLSARKFYEKHGFRMTGETAIIEGTDKTDLCYELILNRYY